MTSSLRIAPRSPATALSTGGPAGGRLSGLDGLRGLAVTLVVVYHLFPPVLRGGFIGVDIFFVISGFLITGLIVAERDRTGRFSPRRFWLHRARRLLPALVPLVLLACTTAWLIGGDVLVGLGWKLLGAATFSYNWVSTAANTSYFGSGQPELFRNLWSLAVEEQFYLLWPLLLLLLVRIRRPGLRLALVGTLALASAVWMGVAYQPGADPSRVYYGSDTHSFGLLIGAALALLLRPLGRAVSLREAATGTPAAATGRAVAATRAWWGAGALAGLLAAAIWLPDNAAGTYRGGLLLVSLASAVAIWAGVAGGRFGRMLDAAPLRYLGERSYGLYLWHWPLLVLLQLVAPFGRGNVVATGMLTLLLAVAAAAISYRWLEMPIRRHGLRGAVGLVRDRVFWAGDPAGATGSAGATGPAGAAAADHAGPTDPAAATGPADTTNHARATAPASATGHAGPTDPAGATGRAAATGPAGATWPAAAAGPAGASRRRRPVAVLAMATAGVLLLLAGTVASVVAAPTVTTAQAEVLRGQQALERAAKAAAEQAAADAQAPGEAAEASRGSNITAVGDSVMLASAVELQTEFPGIVIDAAVSRGMAAAPKLLAEQRAAGTLRPVVLLGLGTNGPIDPDDLSAIMGVIGPSRELIVVNAFAERDWTLGVNTELATFSARRSQVVLADWSGAIAPHVDVLAADGIHPGPTGGGIYADTVATALERLPGAPQSRAPGADTLQAFRVR
ncbi:acyltransferase family protein [Cryobacterium sp. SO1]|uniref:acyltransferase family protein n=1 Tax=Cryobacterium sp. SO1 TaxID=1897061 RepID=UPI001022A26C|nr:acyltransferase family protein [Cryobacterium sp. SO1]RZI37582.1 O-acetyltransferase OatA [Cryobacterium sp. SO1]